MDTSFFWPLSHWNPVGCGTQPRRGPVAPEDASAGLALHEHGVLRDLGPMFVLGSKSVSDFENGKQIVGQVG